MNLIIALFVLVITFGTMVMLDIIHVTPGSLPLLDEHTWTEVLEHLFWNWVLKRDTQKSRTCSKSAMKLLEKSEICSKLTIKALERRQWLYFGVFIVDLNIFHIFFYSFYCWLWTGKCLLDEEKVLSRQIKERID